MKNRIQELVDSGMSAPKIAEEIGVAHHKVRYQIRKHKMISSFYKKKKESLKKCTRCGEENQDEFYNRQKITCKSCQILETSTNKRNRRKFILNTMGNQCEKCGYSKCAEALEVHHLDSKTKDENFTTVSSWSEEKILKEIKKCVLLCANCHREAHARMED